MRLNKLLFSFLILLFSFPIAFAQEDVIKVESSIVRLNVGVVDDKGRPITSLNRGNFAVYEDGVKQDISRFEPTVAPFSVVLVLDMSGSTLNFRQTIQQSAMRFIDALAPEDRVAVIEFYDKVNLRNDFTSDRRIITNSIAAANGRGKTQLYKALDLALDKLSKEGNRRKAIIVLTDGVDTAAQGKDRDLLGKSKENEIQNAIKPETGDIINRILKKSDAQGATVYPLVLPTSKISEPTPIQIAMNTAARARLQILAERTGGTFNAINNLEDMGRLYAAVAADLRALYTVEYQPVNSKRDGKWRAIKIEVNNPELISRTRQGYFAK